MFVIIVLLIATVASLSSCSQSTLNNTTSDNTADNTAAGSNGSGMKRASSMSEYIDQALTWDNLTEKETQILKNAKKSGEISLSDYEATWSDYKTCMKDRGYPDFAVSRYGNIYVMPSLNFTGTEEQWNKYQEDYQECYGSIQAVDSVYRMQWGNPSLYSDRYEAVADCLKRENKVPSSYTAKDLRNESENNKYAFFEEKDAIFRGCKIANNWHSAYEDDVRIDLWKQ